MPASCLAPGRRPGREGYGAVLSDCRPRNPTTTELVTPTSAAVSAASVSSVADASEKLMATSFDVPSASRIAAVAPMPATAPPAVTGMTAAAAARHSTTIAPGGEKPVPSAISRHVLPSARDVQQPKRKAPATAVDL